MSAQTTQQRYRYKVAAKVFRLLCPEFPLPDDARTWATDRDFIPRYLAASNGTLIDQADKKYVLQSVARLVSRVPGDLAECGSFTGLSARFLMDGTMDEAKEILLFDSFEGLSKPEGRDGFHWKVGDLRGDAAKCLKTLGPHASRAKIFSGWIPTRFEEVRDRYFSLVHIDVDLYVPHVDSIAFFWPRINAGGVLILDDFGSDRCPGARQAVLEYFERDDVLDLPTGQALVFKR